MAASDYWRLDGTVIGGFPGPATEARTTGETHTVPVLLRPASDSDSGAYPGHVDRYRTLRDYQPHAGEFVTYDPIAGGVMYREQHQRAPSLLVGLQPPADTQTGLGMWGLVGGLTDSTTMPEKVCQLEFELTYLADYSEYATRADVAAALEATGP